MGIEPALFSSTLASWASGVTIITTGRNGNYRGMTASAFSSLSLNPPLVLVCVDKGANTHALLQQTGAFNVNILAQGQEGMSRTFATKGDPARDYLQGVEYTLAENGVPRLPGCIGYLDCAVVHAYEGGDHTIFVGEVVGADFYENREPLIFYRRNYWKLAPID